MPILVFWRQVKKSRNKPPLKPMTALIESTKKLGVYMYLNRTNLIGRLVADPEFKKSTGAEGTHDRVWSRIAVNRPGSKEVDYFPFVCWDANARAVSNHCKKGKVLILDGQLRTRSVQREDLSWDNYFEVNCDAVYFGPDAGYAKNTAAPAQNPTPPPIDQATALALQQFLTQMQETAKATPAPAAAPPAEFLHSDYPDIPL